MNNRIFLGAAAAAVLLASGCTNQQRDSALSAVRDIQNSGVAHAAEPVEQSGGWELMQSGEAEAPADPSAPPALPVADAAPGEEAPAADPIADFMESDPRDILVEKAEDLESRKTEPWNEDKPETFIAETGRKDPLSFVSGAMPEELLPPRTGDDDESELVTYLVNATASDLMLVFANQLQCHSVIQIGAQKYAQMSIGPQRFTLSDQSGFSNPMFVDGIMYNVAISVISIATDEVVVDLSVSAQGVNVTDNKQLVFIPRI